MEFEKLLSSELGNTLVAPAENKGGTRSVDFSRTKRLEVTRDLYMEAQARGMSLSELLEQPEYDPSPAGSPLDAFERQLATKGLRTSGRNAVTVEMFYRGAPALLPEFVLREIRRGMGMRPELGRLLASSASVTTSRYSPFKVDHSANDTDLSLRPVGEAAEIPSVNVTEQNNTIVIPDYGLTLKVTYKALRYRSMAQFRVLLWYVGYRLQSDKVALVVDTIINGDGNSNAASVINTDVTGTLDYDDLVKFWNEFYPYQPNVLICHKDKIRNILTLAEFKDPLIGFSFQANGEITSPLGATLIRCDEVPADFVIGLDNRFAMEEVVSQPLMIEYDKVIEQRIEEAVISESLAYAKIIKESSLVLDTVWS
ncbi:MAG: hypothetical protein A2W25_04945 [candidate division Zixibacteria bacterium RBG_16_53_22]|nr:MAG: hypothetical protein A2W25_04945 [candidate division Zixibacteria bacterium RBG_16_53_22]